MDEKTDYKSGFRKGFAQIPVGRLDDFRKDITAALGVNNRNSWIYYRDGKVEPKATQVVRIEQTFANYGITKNIWGKDES